MRARIWVGLVVAIAVLAFAALVTADGPHIGPVTSTAVSIPNTFSFQGQIRQNAALYDGTCDLRFTLYDDGNAGSDVGGGPHTFTNQQVTNGLFNVNLPFGDAFSGGDRWLKTEVRCPSGGGTFTTLAPRQHISATPYAFGLRLPFIGSFSSDGDLFNMTNAGTGSAGHFVLTNPNATGHAALVGEGVASDGVDGLSTNSFGVYGESAQSAGVYGSTSAADNGGVVGVNTANGHGTEGYTGTGSGVYGQADAGYGVEGKSNGGTGVYGSGLYYGVYGRGNSNGVWGSSDNGNGVWGESTGSTGVTGKSSSGQGVHGISSTGDGVYGETKGSGAKGVAGVSPNGIAVYGESSSGKAGQFQGDVQISGALRQNYLGNPARSTPLAYAQVSQDGVFQVGTSNVTAVVWDAANARYVIRFTGFDYDASNFVTLVTPARRTSIIPVVPISSESGDGRLIIYMFDLSGTRIKSNFDFVVYQP